jgi:predicted AAA+ superfamily ATPase
MNKLTIKQVLSEQREEIPEFLATGAVERDKEKEIKTSLKNSLIKVIIGVRRSGKSFLAHRVLRGAAYGYANFDDERLIGTKASDLNDFLEALMEINPGVKNIILDEIQNVHGWELFANRLKRAGYNLVITGSNAKLLSRELATHLTGRHASFELYPFSFGEFLARKDLKFSTAELYLTKNRAAVKKNLEEYMKQGGFPELFSVVNKKQYLRDLFDKIISRDIMPRHKVKFSKDLKEMAVYLFSNFGSRFTYHKLKNIFEIKSVHTIKNYVNYLEEAYLIFELLPFSFKFKEQVKSARKIYCIDNGLINAVSFQNSGNLGHAMENLVFLQLKRKNREVYFYSGKSGHEVDFLIRKNNKVSELIQVCFDLKNIETREREISSLLKASRDLRCKRLTVITWDEEKKENIKDREIIFTSLWKWLLEN